MWEHIETPRRCISSILTNALLYRCALWVACSCEGCQDFWCQEPSAAMTLSAIKCYQAPAISSSRGLRSTLFAFEESAGSKDHKQLVDALRATVWEPSCNSASLCCWWVLTSWLLELMTKHKQKVFQIDAKLAKNKQETTLQSIANVVRWARQLLSGQFIVL